jgi:2,4-dienoyl-CoA reductase-like NADH-dependent reductase (Old Yellow Enzyme family)
MPFDSEHNRNIADSEGEGNVHLLRRVEVYLRRSGMAPTRFGREAVRDPRFVFDLRKGREPRQRIVNRVCAYLEPREGGSGR